jgi:hypothetical protein
MSGYGMATPGAKRSLVGSHTIASVASIGTVLGLTQRIHKLHLLDGVAWGFEEARTMAAMREKIALKSTW